MSREEYWVDPLPDDRDGFNYAFPTSKADGHSFLIHCVELKPNERIFSRENVDRILSGMPWLSSDGQNIILEELFGATDEGEGK